MDDFMKIRKKEAHLRYEMLLWQNENMLLDIIH